LLTRKLRWLTLGGQYDWTAKRYPTSPPPPFPPDIAALLTAVFADAEPQAAIVNLYSPGDTLSLHRDVAEGSRKGLSSVSLGCEGVFVVGPGGAGAGADALREGKEGDGEGCLGVEGEERGGRDREDAGKTVLALRLPSGSAVYMSGEARFAWHGVPQIVAGTCPAYLEDWPAAGGGEEEGEFEAWRGWMSGKRVNLNVRQMWD
jgi:alkylated DNA repair protein alkB family protein 1